MVVWLPFELKERVKDAIPKELFNSIATEKEVSTSEELRKFLEERHHPIVERWKKAETVAVEQPPKAIPQIEEIKPQPSPIEAPPSETAQEIYQAKKVQGPGGIKVTVEVPYQQQGQGYSVEVNMEGVRVMVKKAVLRQLKEEERTR